METFGATSPEPSPSLAKRRVARLARRFERFACHLLTYFPLTFVYGLTTWSVWVEVRVGIWHTTSYWRGTIGTALGILFYLLMNISYTVAVFTDPGSPFATLNQGRRRGNHEYSHLPTTETPQYSSLTVSSTGGTRFCKKCQCLKPDRAHHCSTCKQCVLKMDHHCPWLATCVGFYNYKAFLLFLIYTCIFCYVCFIVSSTWVWTEMLHDTQYMEKAMPISVILLAIISGILGLVLTGFTAWHISLALRGLTTIECLEKTRYLSPLRKTLDRQRQEWRRDPYDQFSGNAEEGFGETLHSYGQQFIDMHANAIPGVTRAEEGEERASPTVGSRESPSTHPTVEYNPTEHPNNYQSPAQQSLYRSYEELEQARERDRYEEYLDERDSEKLPNAFDHGWRKNLTHLFGVNPLLWPIPLCTTTGDGWHWEPSPKWLETKQRIEQRRIERHEENQRQQQFQRQGRSQQEPWKSPGTAGSAWVSRGRLEAGGGMKPPQRNMSNVNELQRPSTGVSMKTLRPRSPRPRPGEGDIDADDASDRYSTSSDENEDRALDGRNSREWGNWD